MYSNMTVFQVPSFNATFTDGEIRNIPITDHDPVVAYTALGTVVSLNAWCPGSPISPAAKQMGILNQNSQIAQMKAMAHYYFSMATGGKVSLFAEQEVPNPNIPNSGFKVLNDELQALCYQYNKTNLTNPINLEFQHWAPTLGTRSGTCLLVNTAKVKATGKQAPSFPGVNGRFALYEIQSIDNPAIKFDLYNIHGDYTKQVETATCVQTLAHSGAMVCGDLNIAPNSPAENILKQLPSSPHYQSNLGRWSKTIDGFYDAYTPRYHQPHLGQIPQQQTPTVSYNPPCAPQQQFQVNSAPKTVQPATHQFQQSPVIYAYAFKDSQEMIERYGAFLLAIEQWSPFNFQTMLANIAIVGNNIHITDLALNQYLQKRFNITPTPIIQQTQPVAYPPSQSYVPQPSFFSPQQLSVPVPATRQSAPQSQIHPDKFSYENPTQALQLVNNFSSAMGTNYPRDQRGYLLNLQLRGKEIHIADPELSMAWKKFTTLQYSQTSTSPHFTNSMPNQFFPKSFDITPTPIIQQTQPVTYPQPQSHVPQPSFFSQQQLSNPVPATRQSAPQSQIHPDKFSYENPTQALQLVNNFSSAMGTNYPRDQRGYLLNLQLRGKEVHITDPELSVAWKNFTSLQYSQTSMLYKGSY